MIYCKEFSVGITDLSANTAIKFKFRTFYAIKLTKNVLFPFATNYHIKKREANKSVIATEKQNQLQ